MSSQFDSRVASSLQDSLTVKQHLIQDQDLVSLVSRAVSLCLQAVKAGKKLLLFGNGGSAADCQHIAADFVGRFAFDRAAMPAIALTVNSSSLTAIANDYGFEQVFSRQIEALGQPGDVAIGLSTSGNSPNVVLGLTKAAESGLHTVALTGASGGKLKHCAIDVCICVPSGSTPRIQECHTLIGHIISEIVEQELFHAQGRVSGS